MNWGCGLSFGVTIRIVTFPLYVWRVSPDKMSKRMSSFCCSWQMTSIRICIAPNQPVQVLTLTNNEFQGAVTKNNRDFWSPPECHRSSHWYSPWRRSHHIYQKERIRYNIHVLENLKTDYQSNEFQNHTFRVSWADFIDRVLYSTGLLEGNPSSTRNST